MGLLLCIAVGGSLLGVIWAARTGSRPEAGLLRLGDERMPLEISGPEEFERFLLGLRSYQYRAKRRARIEIREFYYDTPDWSLGRRGHSYRLTRRLGEDGVPTYSLRTAGVESGGRRFEVVSEVPGPLAERILAGSWEQALPGRLELPSGQRLREVLAALGVGQGDLAVRGFGDVTLDRFDVRDKGRTWFELDYEEWVFSALGADAEGVAPFRWYGFALRPGAGPADEEFRERVHQMERVLPTFHRFRAGKEPRLARAVAYARENRGVETEHVVLVSVDGLPARYLEDARAKLPNLRKLAAAGVSAEGMLTSFPSITWPAHASLVTGTTPARHGVIGNAVWDREQNRPVTYVGDPTLTKDETIRVPTLYDAAHDAGLSTASVIWPSSNGAASLDWIIPDSYKPELHARYTTPGFAAELSKAGIDISQLGVWRWRTKYTIQRDRLYTQVTRYLLKEHRVNLILVHLITPDGVQHTYGPDTREAYAAVAESDRQVGEIWDALQQPPLAGKSALFVVSDHGFAPYRQEIRPNVVLRQLGLIATDGQGEVTKRRAWCMGQGGAAFVYWLDDEHREPLLSETKKALASIEGVSAVLEPPEFMELGLPDPATHPEAPDLVVMAGPGYSFDDRVTGPAVADAGGDRGTHGYDPHRSEMRATFIAVGAGIRSGVTLKDVRSIDVAPTIAHLLGLELTAAEGRVLREALER